MEEREELLSALEAIPASGLDYDDWLKVGMALKNSGLDWQVWDDWSRSDSRYQRGECQKKWRGFGGGVTQVTKSTIFDLAYKQGWKPAVTAELLDYNSTIQDGEDDTGANGSQEMACVNMLRQYIEALFLPTDIIGYVTTDLIDIGGGKKRPGSGSKHRTAEDILADLNKYPNDICDTVGDYTKSVGGWIRFNPLDGEGVKNENVTEFRFALVESDDMPLQEQEDAYRKLNLPIAAMVYSGGKSIHAIVHIDASNYTEYAVRVDELYSYLQKQGISVDRQNRNPSRLSRMPGLMRNGVLQRLIGVNIGPKSWVEWKRWLEDSKSPLPAIVSYGEVMRKPRQLSPEIITGILRKGHKMAITGPSKAGKSFALIQLAICFAEGIPWLRWKCQQGRVLYINMEIDTESLFQRIDDVYGDSGLNIPMDDRHGENLDVWNLRGMGLSLDTLADRLVEAMEGRGYIAVILDPIYKVMMGDENSAADMGRFFAQMDRVCKNSGAAFIYVHHHSKGSQGAKKAIDRGSGSGVFGRDADALIDVCPLELSEEMQGRVDPRLAPFQLSFTLREFAGAPDTNIFFKHPLWLLDRDGLLTNAAREGTSEAGRLKRGSGSSLEERMTSLNTAFQLACAAQGVENGVDIAMMVKVSGKNDRTIRNWVKDSEGRFTIERGILTKNTAAQVKYDFERMEGEDD